MSKATLLNLHYMLLQNMIIDLCPKSKFLIYFFPFLTFFNFIRRELVMNLLKKRYAEHVKKNLPIFDISEKNLKGFTTTEKDKKRGVERFPPDNFRNYDHDLIKEEPVSNTTP